MTVHLPSPPNYCREPTAQPPPTAAEAPHASSRMQVSTVKLQAGWSCLCCSQSSCMLSLRQLQAVHRELCRAQVYLSGIDWHWQQVVPGLASCSRSCLLPAALCCTLASCRSDDKKDFGLEFLTAQRVIEETLPWLSERCLLQEHVHGCVPHPALPVPCTQRRLMLFFKSIAYRLHLLMFGAQPQTSVCPCCGSSTRPASQCQPARDLCVFPPHPPGVQAEGTSCVLQAAVSGNRGTR